MALILDNDFSISVVHQWLWEGACGLSPPPTNFWSETELLNIQSKTEQLSQPKSRYLSKSAKDQTMKHKKEKKRVRPLEIIFSLLFYCLFFLFLFLYELQIFPQLLNITHLMHVFYFVQCEKIMLLLAINRMQVSTVLRLFYHSHNQDSFTFVCRHRLFCCRPDNNAAHLDRHQCRTGYSSKKWTWMRKQNELSTFYFRS